MHEEPFFIALSGFLSGYNAFKRDVSKQGLLSSTICDLRNGITKLFPFLLVVVFFMVLCRAGSFLNALACGDIKTLLIDAGPLLGCLTFTSSWIKGISMSYGAMWFLSTIVSLYLFKASTLRMLSPLKRSIVPLLLILIGAVFSVAILSYIVSALGLDQVFWLYNFPPSRYFEYLAAIVLGMICALERDKIARTLNSKCVATVCEIIALFIWIYVPYGNLPEPTWDFRMARWIIPNLLIVFVFALDLNGYVSKVFSKKILVTFGAMSMSCYMFHEVIIRLCTRLIPLSVHGGILFILFCLALTVILASLCTKDSGSSRVSYPVKCGILFVLVFFCIPLICRVGYIMTSMMGEGGLVIDFEVSKPTQPCAVYYMTPKDSGFSERGHLRNQTIEGNRMRVFLPRQTSCVRIDFKNSLPPIIRCKVGEFCIDKSTIKVEHHPRYGFSSYLVRIAE